MMECTDNNLKSIFAFCLQFVRGDWISIIMLDCFGFPSFFPLNLWSWPNAIKEMEMELIKLNKEKENKWTKTSRHT